MLSTIPRVSSVWNVHATSAGSLTAKLVSGLPSGSTGCTPFLNFLTGNSPRIRRRSSAMFHQRRDARPAYFGSVVGSVISTRIAWTSSLLYFPASAPWTKKLPVTPPHASPPSDSYGSGPPNTEGAPENTDVTLPSGTMPRGYVSRL